MYYTPPRPSSSCPSSSSSNSIVSSIVDVVTSAIFPFSLSDNTDMSSLSPSIMNSVLSVQQRSSSASLSLSRAAFGWTTTVAISLMLVQWIGNKDKKKSTPLDWITRMLSVLWSDQRAIDQSSTTTPKSGESNAKLKDDTVTVLLNRGSCHCGAITFKLTPAREVRVIQTPLSGKLQYPTARVPSDQLHLITGKHLWNTYHVQSEETGETWAYSFCGHCAVHLLHATDADQSSLFVNLQCFNFLERENNNEQEHAKYDNTSSYFVPRTLSPDGDDSVVTRRSVVSTVTAATQKSLLTNVTSLPDYANPRTFGQMQHQTPARLPHTPSVGDDSGDTDSAAPVERSVRSSRRRAPKTSRLSPMVERGGALDSEDRDSLPRGVVAYSASSQGLSFNSRLTSSSSSASPHSRFENPVAPVAEWPVNDEREEEEEDDDKDSISSHSGDLDYFSSSTMEGNTATTTTGTSSSASSIDYNVTLNREQMLHNMRKHLKSFKPTTPITTTTNSSNFTSDYT